MHRFPLFCLSVILTTLLLPAEARALDDEHYRRADAAIRKGVEFLRQAQGEDGSWTPQPGPAVTAMAARVMLDRADISSQDPAVEKALAYILSKVKDDGGIHDGFLENYNTAICLSALAAVNDRPEAAAAIRNGQDFLRRLQWSSQADPQSVTVDEAHPFYGGAGYGNHGRPDMSNTQIMLEGLYDSGLDCNDPAFQRALIFITRCQGTAANGEFGDRIMPDGGFIYATSLDKDNIGVPQSMAGEETVDVPGQGRVSRLRTYGSMTYAGFKSYLYAQLDRDDPRVVDAFNWIRRNYTLDHNPGMRDDPETPQDERMQGYYYYLMTFSRALDAWGSSTIELSAARAPAPAPAAAGGTGEWKGNLQWGGGQPIFLEDGTALESAAAGDSVAQAGEAVAQAAPAAAATSRRDWANDLIDKLVSLQNEDGSWGPNDADRWMEGDVNLVTCYALIALQHAIK